MVLFFFFCVTSIAIFQEMLPLLLLSIANKEGAIIVYEKVMVTEAGVKLFRRILPMDHTAFRMGGTDLYL